MDERPHVFIFHWSYILGSQPCSWLPCFSWGRSQTFPYQNPLRLQPSGDSNWFSPVVSLDFQTLGDFLVLFLIDFKHSSSVVWEHELKNFSPRTFAGAQRVVDSDGCSAVWLSAVVGCRAHPMCGWVEFAVIFLDFYVFLLIFLISLCISYEKGMTISIRII